MLYWVKASEKPYLLYRQAWLLAYIRWRQQQSQLIAWHPASHSPTLKSHSELQPLQVEQTFRLFVASSHMAKEIHEGRKGLHC